MRKRVLVAAVAVAASVSATPLPAAGLAIPLGLSGSITVFPDLGACATVTAPPGTAFVGTFTAVAELQGPGTRIGTVRSLVPVVAVDYWQTCISGAQGGATAGEGKYVLHAHSTTNEYVEVKQCVVNRGTLTCV